jgi:hypothetical protein
MSLEISLRPPALEVASFAIIAVVCKPNFRTNQVDKLVIHYYPAIVIDRVVSDGPFSIRIVRTVAYIPISRRMS